MAFFSRIASLFRSRGKALAEPSRPEPVPEAPRPTAPAPLPTTPPQRPRPAPEPAPLFAPVDSPEIAALRVRSPEHLCGVHPDMPPEEIRAILARLFRRHNRAASSFDESLRAEAEIMLEAIVAVRHRYLENPPAAERHPGDQEA